MTVETTDLLTVKNFANQLGLKCRGKEFSAQYIYKMIEGGKIKQNHIIGIDGVQFINVKALENEKEKGDTTSGDNGHDSASDKL